ncbi:hypothetical protein Tco_0639100 [Tanacetum coccineum]
MKEEEPETSKIEEKEESSVIEKDDKSSDIENETYKNVGKEEDWIEYKQPLDLVDVHNESVYGSLIEVTFKTPYKDLKMDDLTSERIELLSSRIILSDDDVRRECDRSWDLESGFYKDVEKLGPLYKRDVERLDLEIPFGDGNSVMVLVPSTILDLYFKHFKLPEDVQLFLQSSSAIHHISHIDILLHQIIKQIYVYSHTLPVKPFTLGVVSPLDSPASLDPWAPRKKVAILGVFIATGTGLIGILLPVTESSCSLTSCEPSESTLSMFMQSSSCHPLFLLLFPQTSGCAHHPLLHHLSVFLESLSEAP